MDMLGDPCFQALPLEEKLRKGNAWLAANVGHNDCKFVQMMLEQWSESTELKNKLTETENKLTASTHELTETQKRLTASTQINEEMKVELTETQNKLTASTQINLERSLRTLLHGGYAAMVDRTVTPGYFPTLHKEAEVIDDLVDEGVLSLVDALLTDNYLDAPFLDKGTDCNCENEAREKVSDLVRAVLRALKLDDVIQVVSTRTIAGVECDVLLVHRLQRLPFATIEVKKPGSSIDDRKHIFVGDPEKGGNRVAGQVFNQMMALKLFGYQKVFGMISTWNHWRLVSTCRSDRTDDLTSFEESAVKQSLQKFHRIQTNIAADGSPPLEEIVYNGTRISKTKRRVYVSQIIPDPMLDSNQEDNPHLLDSKLRSTIQKSGREILQLVTIFVLKACWSVSDLLAEKSSSLGIIIPRKRMACRILEKDNPKAFAFGTATVTGLAYDKYVSEETNRIYIIRPIGSGGSGFVCLGVSEKSASCCAVKFYHPSLSESSTAAKRELNNWKKVYGQQTKLPMAHVREVGEGSCLVMPYLRPVLEKNRRKLLRDGSIKQALINFASTKCTHGDVRWRHIGYWEGTLFLFDLGIIIINENQDEQQIKDWCSASLKSLTETAGEIEQEQPARTPSNTRSTRNTTRANSTWNTPARNSAETPTNSCPDTRANVSVMSLSGNKRS